MRGGMGRIRGLGCVVLLRPTLLLLTISFPALSAAQIDLAGPASAIRATLAGRDVSNAPAKPQAANQPSDSPALPPKYGDLPPARAYGPQENVMQVVQSETLNHDAPHHIRAEGGVHAVYKGYDIFGATLEGDTETEVFTLSGDVRIIGEDEVIHGQKVTVDFRARTFRAEGVDADLRPSFFPLGRVLDDVYVTGADAYGSQREIRGDYTTITTCNLPDPHFELIAKSSDIRPGHRMILRDVSLWILHRKVIELPYLSIPLDNRNSRIMPEFGHTPDEGYYAKFRLPIALHGNDQFLDAHVDEYSKLGQGLGLDYQYQNAHGNGLDQVYAIEGHANEQDLNLHNDFRFGRSDLTIDSSFQNNNHLSAPDSKLLNLRAQLGIPQANGSFDSFAYSDSSNVSPGFNSTQRSFTVTDNRIFSPTTHSSLNLGYTDNSSSFGGGEIGSSYESRMLDVQLDAQSDLKKALAEFQYQRNIPIGSNNTQFFGLEDQTPVVTLRSDSNRLLSSKWAQQFPFQTDLSVGQYGTESFIGQGIQHIWRSNFDFNYTKPDHPNRKFDYTANLRFQQGVYSDNTAQYVTGVDTGVRYNFARESSLNLHYDYLQQHGFTPLDQDRVGQTNLATADITWKPFRTLSLAGQTGYDFLASKEFSTTPWQSVGLRSEWNPAPYVALRTLATYDTTLKSWSSIRMDLGYKPGATFISAGLLYDGTQHRIGEFEVFIDALKWGPLKSSIILDYDGYTHQFTAEHFQFVYDLHCAEAILQILNNPVGFRPGAQIGFFLRLKAFPFNTPFGIGTRGQAVGGGVGRGIY